MKRLVTATATAVAIAFIIGLASLIIVSCGIKDPEVKNAYSIKRETMYYTSTDSSIKIFLYLYHEQSDSYVKVILESRIDTTFAQKANILDRKTPSAELSGKKKPIINDK
jgi:hypothetical protein